eukprot:42595-Prymnesium_polylepis.1
MAFRLREDKFRCAFEKCLQPLERATKLVLPESTSHVCFMFAQKPSATHPWPMAYGAPSEPRRYTVQSVTPIKKTGLFWHA